MKIKWLTKIIGCFFHLEIGHVGSTATAVLQYIKKNLFSGAGGGGRGMEPRLALIGGINWNRAQIASIGTFLIITNLKIIMIDIAEFAQ